MKVIFHVLPKTAGPERVKGNTPTEDRLVFQNVSASYGFMCYEHVMLMKDMKVTVLRYIYQFIQSSCRSGRRAFLIA